MDPSSIVAGCVDLRGDITHLLSEVQLFVASVTSTERDLRSLPSELNSLHLSVRANEASCSLNSRLPFSLNANLRGVLGGCSHVVRDIRKLLSGFSNLQPDLGSRWAMHGRPSMLQLLTSLEAHKSAIQIGLEMLLM